MANHKSALGTWVLKETLTPPAEDIAKSYSVVCNWNEDYLSDREIILSNNVGNEISNLQPLGFSVFSTYGYTYVEGGFTPSWGGRMLYADDNFNSATSGKVVYYVSDNMRIYETTLDERTLTITGGDDVESADLIEWLEANSDEQPPLGSPCVLRRYSRDAVLIGDSNVKFRHYAAQEDAS